MPIADKKTCHILCRVILTFVTFFSFATNLYAAVTPTQVFIEAHAIKNSLAELVNKKVGPAILPVIDVDLDGAQPRHVFALTFALNAKIGAYMDRNKTTGFARATYPQLKITPADVKEIIIIAQKNLQRAVVDVTFERRDVVDDKSPADVMQQIVIANLWLDKLLLGKVGPLYPLQALERIEHELERLRKHLAIDMAKTAPISHVKALPENVFNNGERFYYLLSLFDKMAYSAKNPIHPYDIPSGGGLIAPVDVYTISVFNLAYLYSVELKMGLTPRSDFLPPLRAGTKPPDVFRHYDKVNHDLMHIIANMGMAS